GGQGDGLRRVVRRNAVGVQGGRVRQAVVLALVDRAPGQLLQRAGRRAGGPGRGEGTRVRGHGRWRGGVRGRGVRRSVVPPAVVGDDRRVRAGVPRCGRRAGVGRLHRRRGGRIRG